MFFMNRFILLLLILLMVACPVKAQYTFSGKIEYEKKTNVHAVLKDNSDGEDDSWYQQIIKEAPKFKSTFFNLVFDSAKSIYKPGREVESSYKGYTGEGPAAENIVL